MKSTNSAKIIAAIKMLLYLSAWLILYGAPEAVFHAGFADGTHVVLEGIAALLLLVPFLKDEPLPRDSGRPLYWRVALVLVPVALARELASWVFCQTGNPAGIGTQPITGTFISYVLRTCVTAPVMEELGCRWIAFGKTRRVTGFWPAALWSTAVFSMIHAGVNRELALAVIPGALLYCLVYELTGKLRYCILGHMALNVLCLPVGPWAAPELDALIASVPVPARAPILIIVTAAVALLCAFRKKIFYRNAGEERRDPPSSPPA